MRLLEAGDTNKNDPNDALSVAIAALRSKGQREVPAEDYAAVLKVWSKRHRDLSRARNQVACRLHAVLCDLVPGGFSKEISARQAARVLEQITPSGAIARARHELAGQFLAGLRSLDTQLRETKKKLAAAVSASRTTVTEDLRRRPGHRRHHHRRHRRHHPLRQPGSLPACNGTAPVEVSSGNRKIYRLSLRGNRRVNHAVHMAAITQIRYRHSDGRAYYDPKIAEGTARKEALRCSNGGSATPSTPAFRPAPARPARRAREGNQGTTLTPARPTHTPNASSSDQPLPDLTPPDGPVPQQPRLHRRRTRPRRESGQPLDNNSKEDSICARQVVGMAASAWVRNRAFGALGAGVATDGRG